MFETWRGRTLRRCLGTSLCLLSLHFTVAPAQDLTPGTSWLYQLTEGSQITDDCPICDRLPIVVPMTGTFRLHFLEETPISTRYEIQDISFHAGTKGGAEYWVNGSGT